MAALPARLSLLLALAVLPCAGTPSCAVANAVGRLESAEPPPELGRPGWVRTSARIGGWVGGVLGAVVSVAVLPVTYPISLLADRPLGMNDNEFLLFPLQGGAALGHFVLGAPADVLDYGFRRAWIEPPPGPANPYEFVPLEPLAIPPTARHGEAAATPAVDDGAARGADSSRG